MFAIKTHALLINTSPFYDYVNSDRLKDYLYEYADTALKPYHAIGMFAYKEFPKDKEPIFGYSTPNELINLIITYSTMIFGKYLHFFQTLNLKDDLISPSTQASDTFKVMQILSSGVYLYESCFYNCNTKSSHITKEEWVYIKANIKDYAMIFVNLYV